VTLPGVRVALIAACLLGFTLSMDEIAVTFFLAGTQPTLPVYVWGLLRFGFTPEVNAAFTLIAGGSLTFLGIAAILLLTSSRRRELPRERRRRRTFGLGRPAAPSPAGMTMSSVE
jgi:ABC-type spermidine/putrescine transport system permease subunit II